MSDIYKKVKKEIGKKIVFIPSKLMSILKEYVNNANEDTEHEPSFRQAMKSLEYIFKFIVRSRELFAM